MIKKEVILHSKHDNRPFDLDVVASPDFRFQPIILFLHGFKGFKDWGHFNAMAEFFAENGFAFCKFNFSHNGVLPEHNTDLTDMEAFAANNLTTELADLEVVLHYFQSGKSASEGILIDKNSVVLMGHSRGGGLAIVKAAEGERGIKALITLGALSSFEHLWEGGSMEAWQQEGRRYIRNSRTGQDMPLDYQLVEDFLKNHDRLDIISRAGDVEHPWLIVHGENDETVPLRDAFTLAKANGHAQTHVVPATNHTFGSSHPGQNGLPQPFQEAMHACLDFLQVAKD